MKKAPDAAPTFRIEKGIPMPTSGKGISMFPFMDMEIGDSFAVSAEFGKKLKSAAYLFSKREGIRLTCRSLPDGTVRCWRVKK